MTKPLNTEDSLVHLQEDIDKIYEWSSLKHLKFNANKCKFMILSKRHDSVLVLNPPTLLLGELHSSNIWELSFQRISSGNITSTWYVPKLAG